MRSCWTLRAKSDLAARSGLLYHDAHKVSLATKGAFQGCQQLVAAFGTKMADAAGMLQRDMQGGYRRTALPVGLFGRA